LQDTLKRYVERYFDARRGQRYVYTALYSARLEQVRSGAARCVGHITLWNARATSVGRHQARSSQLLQWSLSARDR